MINLLPFFLGADLLIPFALTPSYPGYSNSKQVMSALGNKKAPLHLVYNIWLVVLGVAILLSTPRLLWIVGEASDGLSAWLCCILIVYAVGGCILSGLFAVDETKGVFSTSAKMHALGSTMGFIALALAPLIIGLYFVQIQSTLFAVISFVCFALTLVFFTLFVMADKPRFATTTIARAGLWQRLTLLSMYIPIVLLCISYGNGAIPVVGSARISDL